MLQGRQIPQMRVMAMPIMLHSQEGEGEEEEATEAVAGAVEVGAVGWFWWPTGLWKRTEGGQEDGEQENRAASCCVQPIWSSKDEWSSVSGVWFFRWQKAYRAGRLEMLDSRSSASICVFWREGGLSPDSFSSRRCWAYACGRQQVCNCWSDSFWARERVPGMERYISKRWLPLFRS